MDPNETLKLMRDETADPADRLEAAQNLRQWITNGGFLPSPLGISFGGNTAARFWLTGKCDEMIAAMSKEASDVH